MDLQISVFLLFILFTAGHSLYCYECLTENCKESLVKCPINATRCESSTVVTQAGFFSSTVKVKGCAVACQSGSMNLGVVKTSTSCCGSYFCNVKDAPDPRATIPNGKTCYYCDEKSCSNIMRCSGTEDRCITDRGTFGGQSMIVKGCVSKSICDAAASTNAQGVSCCEGNLCNSDKSFTQSYIQSVTQSYTFNGA
ncbi:ly6/PLAUR domain-containing protein 3-like [Megalobrama amblycephala]|uniref:ly6/PLAUR domain-containing protein 3-like n=1 Tax=Megalobrama amblycephala TaxID=75352 RepID=UPI002013D272|nr:ly6/PLAUR domain-containing protein 3-like [Megalobrama amblycephala]